MKTILNGAKFYRDGRFETGDLAIEDGKIVAIGGRPPQARPDRLWQRFYRLRWLDYITLHKKIYRIGLFLNLFAKAETCFTFTLDTSKCLLTKHAIQRILYGIKPFFDSKIGVKYETRPLQTGRSAPPAKAAARWHSDGADLPVCKGRVSYFTSIFESKNGLIP